jgi:HSP20 family molecular chaperone IbpA
MLIALPQVDPQSIELETVGHKLHLKAYTQDQTIRYVRQVTFPNHVSWGELTASWHHGILKVELGRADVQTQKINIQVAS